MFVVEDRLMHHKFCIRDVLTGSYNWTHKAARRNEENLVLTTGDPELARHFLREFARLTGQDDAPAADPTGQRVLKRLAVSQSVLTLPETGSLPQLVAAQRAHHYAEATVNAMAPGEALRRGPLGLSRII